MNRGDVGMVERSQHLGFALETRKPFGIMRKGFRQLVDEAKARITTIGLPEARERLGRDNVVFVDLRDIRELEREGMIPGAFHCPRGMLEFWIDPESPYHKPVFAEDKRFVFFCAGGLRSALRGQFGRQRRGVGFDPTETAAGRLSRANLGWLWRRATP